MPHGSAPWTSRLDGYHGLSVTRAAANRGCSHLGGQRGDELAVLRRLEPGHVDHGARDAVGTGFVTR